MESSEVSYHLSFCSKWHSDLIQQYTKSPFPSLQKKSMSLSYPVSYYGALLLVPIPLGYQTKGHIEIHLRKLKKVNESNE